MPADGSITHWLGLLRAGDRAAAQPLWEAYCGRLAALARRKLRAAPRQAGDEEDAAPSAFDSFCRRAEHGLFPQLRHRNDLWQVLVMLTARKAGQLARNACREKRGGGKILLETDLAAADGSGEGRLALVVGRGPTPTPRSRRPAWTPSSGRCPGKTGRSSTSSSRRRASSSRA
jgi:hypothetical protein